MKPSFNVDLTNYPIFPRIFGVYSLILVNYENNGNYAA